MRQSPAPRFEQLTSRIRGIAVAPRTSFGCMTPFLDQRGINPVTDKVYPFDQAVLAFEHLSCGLYGKIVIKVADEPPKQRPANAGVRIIGCWPGAGGPRNCTSNIILFRQMRLQATVHRENRCPLLQSAAGGFGSADGLSASALDRT